MNTAAQLRLAADIIETGHPWEYKSQTTEIWHKTNSSPLTLIAGGAEIRLAFARPPYEAELHNTDNLTPDQVGAGYRLVLPDESTKQPHEFWSSETGKWVQALQATSLFKHFSGTYRLPLSVPWPEQSKPAELTPELKSKGYEQPDDSPPWIEWHGGECPLKDEEVEEWEYKAVAGFYCKNPGSPPSFYKGWQKGPAMKIIAYRVLKWRKKKPMVPLEPDDVPPFSVIRRKPEQDNGQQWHWRCVSYVYGVGVQCGNRGYKWEELQKDYQINRSIPLTGKWNPDAWEPCEK